ncbi:MAG: hypothetical protein L3J71_05945 [Victivallaceae bacterium]|nr:hypothetical protein [Victivallaceae bacterium]
MNSCCIISWNSSKVIYGLCLKKQGSKRLVEAIYCDKDDATEESFVERLKTAYDKLNCRDSDFIAVSGALQNATWFDLDMPDLPLPDTVEALQYELPQLFPLPQDEMVWQCRKTASHDNSRATIRVFALPRVEWNKLLEKLESSEITADAFMTPFMVIDPILSEHNLYLPNIDENFYFERATADSCRHMRNINDKEAADILSISELRDIFITADNIQGLNEHFIPALVVAEYIFSGTRSRDDAKAALPLPPRLKPSRLKFLKIATLFTGLAALLCLTALFTVDWLEAYGRYETLKNEISELKHQLNSTHRANTKSEKRVKIIENLLNSIPKNPKLLDILCDLSQKLPHNMWITSYRTSGQKIYITIKSSSESNNIQNKLRSSSLFNLDNFRSRRNLDGTYYIYLQLKTREQS